MKRCCCNLFFFLLLFHTAKSTTWITISNGNWNDNSIWLSGVAPSFSNNDTIIIRDTITFDENIFLNSGAFMQVDSLGGALCGHNNIVIKSNARLHVHGALSIDTLFIKGGVVNFILGGTFLMWYATITDGGSMHISNSSGCVCLWETCFVRIPSEPPPEDTVIINNYIVFPNPSNGNFNLQYTQVNESMFYLFNVLGQIIFSTKLEGTAGIKNFNMEHLNHGIYLWAVRSGDVIYERGKHHIIRNK